MPQSTAHAHHPRSNPDSVPRSALIVEDCSALHAPLQELLRPFATDVRVATTCAEAARCFEQPGPLDLLLLDVCLPDGTALDVLGVAQQRARVPAIVAMSGETDAATAFKLAQRGVREFVSKPIHAANVRQAIARSLEAAPDLTMHVRASVGHVPIHELEQHVRETMLSEALAQAEGNRRAAARLLSISRQLLQHMLRARA